MSKTQHERAHHETPEEPDINLRWFVVPGSATLQIWNGEGWVDVPVFDGLTVPPPDIAGEEKIHG